MAVGIWTPTNTTRSKILDGTFKSGDSYKCALFLSTSNLGAASTTYAGLTNEHANSNGYTTTGVAVTFSLSGTTDVDVSFVANPFWEASGGSIVARRAAIYKVGGDVAWFCLLDTTAGGTDVTVADGNILRLKSDGVINPVFSLA